MFQSVSIPPARAAILRAMSDEELSAEVGEIRRWIGVHEPHVCTDMRARFSVDALASSLAYALTEQDRRTR